MDDMILRRAAIDAVHKEFDECLVWDESGKYTADEVEMVLADVPSAEVETKMPLADCISRQAAIDALAKFVPYAICDESTESYTNGLTDAYYLICRLPSEQPERMTNRQWIDFLSVQFDISRTSAKEMLHGMMRWKKEDNFKKMFNGGKT